MNDVEWKLLRVLPERTSSSSSSFLFVQEEEEEEAETGESCRYYTIMDLVDGSRLMGFSILFPCSTSLQMCARVYNPTFKKGANFKRERRKKERSGRRRNAAIPLSAFFHNNFRRLSLTLHYMFARPLL